MKCDVKQLKYMKDGLFYKFRVNRMKTGGTNNARYCYAVWMRHLLFYYKVKHRIPDSLAEFGPGDTIGTGIMALLCGCKEYYALDFMRYQGMSKIDYIFSQLIQLLKNREDIPDEKEFPELYPRLDSYRFPAEILPDEWLDQCMSEERIESLKQDIRQLKRGQDSDHIHYLAPWWKQDYKKIQCDLIISQAVFEHIDNWHQAHTIISGMLKSGGIVSHEIDFNCHGCSEKWNGHWGYNRLVWKCIYGSRPWFINRTSAGDHIRAIQSSGVKIICCLRGRGKNGITREELSREYRLLNDRDFETRNCYILGVKV